MRQESQKNRWTGGGNSNIVGHLSAQRITNLPTVSNCLSLNCLKARYINIFLGLLRSIDSKKPIVLKDFKGALTRRALIFVNCDDN